MELKALVLFSVMTILVGQVLSVPTCTQVNTLLNAINGVFNSNLTFPPTAIRLAFHDCVGGCNGCVNLNQADNNGLQYLVNALNNAYTSQSLSSICSRADFYALTAIYSITKGVRNSNMARSRTPTSPCPIPAFNLQWGRVDAADCSSTVLSFPSPTMTANQMFAYFQQNFNFNADQVVALMGAHTMGRAARENSGYRGPWKPGQVNSFDERFYTRMITAGWTNTNVAPPFESPKWQFLEANGSGGLMLNTDFELFYNLTLDASARTTCQLSPTCGVTNTCTSTQCPKSSTFAKAQLYSSSCSTFMTDFKAVFELMLRKGAGTLTTMNCPLP